MTDEEKIYLLGREAKHIMTDSNIFHYVYLSVGGDIMIHMLMHIENIRKHTPLLNRIKRLGFVELGRMNLGMCVGVDLKATLREFNEDRLRSFCVT